MEQSVSKVEFQKLEKTVSHVEKMLNEVHGAIVGNPLSEDGGIRRRLADAEKELIQLSEELDKVKEKQIKYNLYTIIMWSSLGGVAMAIFFNVLQTILK